MVPESPKSFRSLGHRRGRELWGVPNVSDALYAPAF